MVHSPSDSAPVSRPAVLRLASFHRQLPPEPLFRDWLRPSRNALFRWTMAMASSGDGRRVIAATAVSIQRLRGDSEFTDWLYGAAVQAATHQQDGLDESSLTGLPPELRTLLRLVARGELRRVEAQALLSQHMGFVRRRLVQARLSGSLSAPAPLDALGEPQRSHY
jgi:DNA-directed RNA polymerase specialized sigma24 family protein